MFIEMTGANEKYTTKRYINVHIACLTRGNIFGNVRFPKETRQNLPFIEKYATTSKFSYI